MGNLSNWLSGGQQGAYQDMADAYQKAMGTMNQYQQQGQQQLQPYENAGASAIPQFQNFVNGLPSQMNGNWMNTYQQSPYAKYLTTTGLNSMNNAAAATGALGSGANQQENAQLSSDIAGKDMQNFFNNMQAQNQQYLGGVGDLMHQGAATSISGAGINQGYANALAELLANQGKAQGASDMAENQGEHKGIGSLIGTFLGGK